MEEELKKGQIIQAVVFFFVFCGGRTERREGEKR